MNARGSAKHNAIPVVALDEDTWDVAGEFESIASAARAMGAPPYAIIESALSKRSHDGLLWRFVNDDDMFRIQSARLLRAARMLDRRAALERAAAADATSAVLRALNPRPPTWALFHPARS